MGYIPFIIQNEIDVRGIVSVHYFQFARGYVFTGERHDFWEMVYMDRGSAEIGADGARFLLNEGEIVFHKPGEFHTIWAGGSKAPNIVVVSFVCDSPAMVRFEGLRSAVDESGKRLIADIIVEAGNAWQNRPDSQYSALIARSGGLFGAAQMVRLSLEALLLKLLRGIGNTAPAGAPGRAHPKTQAGRKEYQDRLAADIEAYVIANLPSAITLGTLCRRFNMSGTSLKQLIRRRTGGGVSAYVSGVRHEAAKRLIREGLLNMTAIADACGYGSLHYFSRRFAQMESMTPSEYARSVKGMAAFDGGHGRQGT